MPNHRLSVLEYEDVLFPDDIFLAALRFACILDHVILLNIFAYDNFPRVIL